MQQLYPRKTTEANIETRIAARLKSIFSAMGMIVSDFYLEAGIYFVGAFNAALVSWDIYTDLVSDDQPLLYAVLIAIVAFIAVEGLAVYLVGAAAKTGNGWLWFFSGCFALFFTYAHSQEMSQPGIISQYITLAIPFFVVIGYWARTVKLAVETDQANSHDTLKAEAARKQKLEAEARELDRKAAQDETERKQKLEDDQIEFDRQLKQDKLEKAHLFQLAKLERQTGKQPEIPARKNSQIEKGDGLPGINSSRKMAKAEIIDRLPGLVSEGLTNVEIGEAVGRNERTIRNYKRQLNGSLGGK